MADPKSLRFSICQYLKRHTTMSLATCCDNQPWSTDLFYVSDKNCCLYFVSSPTTRHCQYIAANPQVSVSVSGEVSDWVEIKGLQLDGVSTIVSDSERAGVLAIYLAKFVSLKKLYQAPENYLNRQIIDRLQESHFYRISPKWIRLIDNTKGFGNKEEICF